VCRILLIKMQDLEEKKKNLIFSIKALIIGLVIVIIILEFNIKYLDLLAAFIMMPLPFLYLSIVWHGTEYFTLRFNNKNSNYVQIIGIVIVLISVCYPMQWRSTNFDLELILSKTFTIDWFTLIFLGGITYAALKTNHLDEKNFYKSFMLGLFVVGVLVFGGKEDMWGSGDYYDGYDSGPDPTEEEIKYKEYLIKNSGYVGLYLQKVLVVFVSIFAYCKIHKVKLGYHNKLD